MSFAQEGSWASATIAGNAAATTITPTFLGGGAELLIVPLIIDVSSGGAVGASIANHANFTSGAPYIAAVANNELMVFCWGKWVGPAQSPSLTIAYTSGNAGPNGGKVQSGVFTGYATNIINSPGPSFNASGGSSPAAVTLTSVATGSLVVALMNNTGAHSFTAGSGYTLAFNTSAWAGNVTGLEYTTGLSEPGGNPIVQASFSPNANWSMMAVAFPADLAPAVVPPLLAGRCTYFLP
jgi:hypothetical protein